MTTRLPGARDVLTHALVVTPRSTAALATRPAATSTDGFDVLVHEVMAATVTAPSRRCSAAPKPSTSMGSRPSAVRKAPRAPDNETRSWGRLGPARLGSTLERSSSTYSEYVGSRASASCQMPWALA